MKNILSLAAFMIIAYSTLAQGPYPFWKDTVLMLDEIGSDDKLYITKEELLNVDSLYLRNVEASIYSYEIIIHKYGVPLDAILSIDGNKFDLQCRKIFESLEPPFVVIIDLPAIKIKRVVKKLSIGLRIYVVE